MTEGAANADTVRGMYTPIASDYDEIWAPLLREFGLRLLDRARLDGAERVLDLGCGVGKLLPDIAERAPDAVVMGCDLVEAMLRVAPARYPRILMDATRWAFAPHAFDAVVSTFMLFHVPRPDVALAGVRAALRPRGRVAIAVWGTGEIFPAMTTWDEIFDRLGVPADPAAAGPTDGRELTNSTEKMAGLLTGAGFTSIETESVEWRMRWELDAFLRWRRGMGPSRRRIASLDPDRREEVLRAAADEIAGLDPDDFVHLDEVIMAWAEAPNPGRAKDVR
jgi:SAM-dependent methyltransferase